jgi:hypothetical protein
VKTAHKIKKCASATWTYKSKESNEAIALRETAQTIINIVLQIQLRLALK